MSTSTLSSTHASPGASRGTRPLWLLWLLLAALIQGGMPLAHSHVFGKERIAEEAVQQIESQMGKRFGDIRTELVAKHIRAQGIGSSVLVVAGTLVLAILTFVVMQVGAILLSTNIPPIRLLGVASLGILISSSFKAALWGGKLVIHGLGKAFTAGWASTAGTSLPILLNANTDSWLYRLSFVDLSSLIAILAMVLVLENEREEISIPQAFFIVSLPTISGWALLFALSFIF